MSAFSFPPRPDSQAKILNPMLPVLPRQLAVNTQEQPDVDQSADAPVISNAGTGISPDQLLYDAFTSFSGSLPMGQTGSSYGLRPEDMAYASALYSANPLDAVRSVSQYATPENFLAGLGLPGSNPTANPNNPGVQQPGNFNAYKADFLGNLSPENALNLAYMLAGPILQGDGQA